MRKNLYYFSFLFVLIASSLLVAAAAQSATVKERMAGRIPTINTLKDQGTIGENNQGFLDFRSESKPDEQLVADENKDRDLVYEAIAKKQGAKSSAVGQRRAKMIVENGKPGHWFQKGDGTWYKK
jgi:uncharacterized protein YdbL (DUF1318 family)